jgi:hypothetical protein
MLADAGSVPAGPMTDLQRTAKSLRARGERDRKVAVIDAVLPTPEQLARDDYRRVKVKEPGVAQGRLALRNMTGCAIDRWLARKMITERQHEAATRYRADYDAAGRERSIVSQYGGGTGSGTGTPNYAGTLPCTLSQMDALERWRNARDRLQPSLRPVFDAIVLHDVAATDAALHLDSFKSAGGAFASRFAPIYVQACAGDLADWYRL